MSSQRLGETKVLEEYSEGFPLQYVLASAPGPTSDCSLVCISGVYQDSFPVHYANNLVDASEWLSTGYDDHLPVFRSLSLFGSASGFYEPIRKTANQFVGLNTKEQSPFTSIFAGAASGAVGAIIGNPLFMIKARMQAYSPALPVGTQHYYKSSWDALKTIYQRERFRGLVRGVDAAILRTSMGSSVKSRKDRYPSGN